MMLFGAVGMVGVIGASTMTVMKGPVKTMSQVTKRTVAENNMIAAGKLALIAASTQADTDCDDDLSLEPIPFGASVTGFTGGGELPASIGVAKLDPWGNQYVYCAWDHGDTIDDAGCGGASQNRLQGVDAETEYVLAVISAGPDGNYQTTCNDYSGPDSVITRTAGADDLVFGYTYGEASTMSGGLWTLEGPDTAEIAKDISIKDTPGGTETFAFDSSAGILQIGDGSTGTGRFPIVNTDNIRKYDGAVGGSINVDAALSSGYDITTTGDISTTGTGNITAAGNATVSGNADVTGTLDVTGTSTLGALDAQATTTTTLNATDAVDFDTTLNVDGTLDVTGATSLTTLGTSGLATLESLGVTNNADVGGDFTVDTNTLYAGAASNRVGIGTASPDEIFHVKQSDTGYVFGGLFENTLANGVGLRLKSGANTVDLSNNPAGDFRINVGAAPEEFSITAAGEVFITNNLNMTSGDITNLATPLETELQYAATVDYVNDRVADGTGYSETDPQVDTLTANMWCVANAGGTAIDCTASTPGETDPQVGTLTNGKWCTTDGTDIDCTSDAPTGGPGTTAGNLEDTDGDTLIQVEEGADDDTIRFDTAGTERMTIGSTGNLGIYGGTIITGSINYPWGIRLTPVTTSGTNAAGIFNEPYFEPASAATVQYGFISNPRVQNSANNITNFYAGFFRPDTMGTYSGDIANLYGIRVGGNNLAGTGTITNLYGLSIDDQNGATNEYGIYQQGADDLNYFAGGLAIGDTTLSSGDQDLLVDITGALGADNYCDASGNNCFTAAGVSGGSVASLNDLTDAATTVDTNWFVGHEGGTYGANNLNNFAIGRNALDSLDSPSSTSFNGDNNFAVGLNALTDLTNGERNTAVGNGALANATTGTYNVAVGNNAQSNSLTNSYNVSLGTQALMNNTANNNTAVGHDSLRYNTTGANNTTLGYYSMLYNQTGEHNVAVGARAGFGITGGSNINYNTLLGHRAGFNMLTGADNNTIIGYNSALTLTTGSNNIVIGRTTDVSAAAASNELNIGDILFGSGVGTTAGSKIGAVEYCDETLTTCFTASGVGSGSGDELVDADGDTKIQVEEGADDDTIRFDTAGNEVMIIDSTGNVEIGSAISAGDATTSTGYLTFSGSGGVDLLRDYTSDGNTSRQGLSVSRSYSAGPGADGIGVHIDLFAETETEGTISPIGQIQAVATDATAGTVDSDIRISPYLDGLRDEDAFVIKSTGNVGIGTDAPESLLHIAGTGNQISLLESTDNNAVQYRLRSNSVNRRIVGLNASDTAESQIILGDDGEISFVGETAGANTHMTFLGNGIIRFAGVTGAAAPTK